LATNKPKHGPLFTFAVMSDATFEVYQEGLREVYSGNDHIRDLNGVWHRIIHRSSELGEQVRETKSEDKDYEALLNPLADVFCWINNFIDRCNAGQPRYRLYPEGEPVKGTPSYIIWEKYPGFCPTCGAGNRREGIRVYGTMVHQCKCSIVEPEEINKTKTIKVAQEEAEDRIERRPQNVDEMVHIFEAIYANRYENFSLEELTLHFLEEVGEVTEELAKLEQLNEMEPAEWKGDSELEKYDHYPNTLEGKIEYEKWKLRREIADNYSWIAAIIIKLNEIRRKAYDLNEYTDGSSNQEFDEIKLSNVLDNRFRPNGTFRCPTCEEETCRPEGHGAVYW
jgi:NTP pyrophosphatase (non-canonical NTP hydrolase)